MVQKFLIETRYHLKWKILQLLALVLVRSTAYYKYDQLCPRIPTVKLKIPGRAFLKSGCRTSVTFKLLFLTLAIYQWLRKSATMKKMWKHFLYLLRRVSFCVVRKNQRSKEFSRHDDSIPYLDNAKLIFLSNHTKWNSSKSQPLPLVDS